MGSKRYGSASSRRATAWHWRDEIPVLLIEKGLALLIEDRQSFTLHLGFDGWQKIQDREALSQPFGMWAVHFSGDELSQYTQIDFTRRYAAAWEGIDHCVLIDHAPVEQLLEPDAERSS
jgi:glucoamylase